MGRRAESLADRIEEGAAGLATFAGGLSEAEWRTRVSETDHRSIGLIVHHVATVYPIEVDLARARQPQQFRPVPGGPDKCGIHQCWRSDKGRHKATCQSN